MNKRKVLKRWREFSNPGKRDRILSEINRSTLADVGASPVGGDKGEKFLRELNEMQDFESDAGQKENPDR